MQLQTQLFLTTLEVLNLQLQQYAISDKNDAQFCLNLGIKAVSGTITKLLFRLCLVSVARDVIVYREFYSFGEFYTFVCEHKLLTSELLSFYRSILHKLV